MDGRVEMEGRRCQDKRKRGRLGVRRMKDENQDIVPRSDR